MKNPDHLLTNWKIITDNKNKIMVDQIIKYENYEEGLDIFSKK